MPCRRRAAPGRNERGREAAANCQGARDRAPATRGQAAPCRRRRACCRFCQGCSARRGGRAAPCPALAAEPLVGPTRTPKVESPRGRRCAAARRGLGGVDCSASLPGCLAACMPARLAAWMPGCLHAWLFTCLALTCLALLHDCLPGLPTWFVCPFACLVCPPHSPARFLAWLPACRLAGLIVETSANNSSSKHQLS